MTDLWGHGDSDDECLCPDCREQPWWLRMPVGTTVEDVAGSLTREAEAIAALDCASVWTRREPDDPRDEYGEWVEITADERRRRSGGLG
jgi:hypothetical protein